MQVICRMTHLSYSPSKVHTERLFSWLSFDSLCFSKDRSFPVEHSLF